MINRFSKLATNSVSGPPFPVEKAQQPTEVLAAQLEEISQMDNSVLAEFIGTRPFDEQIKLLELVAHSRDTCHLRVGMRCEPCAEAFIQSTERRCDSDVELKLGR